MYREERVRNGKSITRKATGKGIPSNELIGLIEKRKRRLKEVKGAEGRGSNLHLIPRGIALLKKREWGRSEGGGGLEIF